MSKGHADHIILNSLLRIQAENLISEKPNKQGPVLSKCSTQQTKVTERTENQTEIVLKDLFLNDPLTNGFKQFWEVGRAFA